MASLSVVPKNYSGPERRQHRVYVTHNTEYHTRDGICVAVRERKTGRWIEDHVTIGHRVEGSVHFAGGGGIVPSIGEPAIGDSIYFHPGDRDLITSRLERVDRPPREIIAHYRTR